MLIALIATVAAWEWGNLAGLKAFYCKLFGGVMLFVCVEMVISEYVAWYDYYRYVPEGFLEYCMYRLDRFVPWDIRKQIELIGLLVYFFARIFWIFIVPVWLCRCWRLNQMRWEKGVLLVLGFFLIIAVSLAFMRLGPSPINAPVTLLLALSIAWVAEIFAYFFTKKFGGRKLNPEISPDMTWVGFGGAMAGVFVYALLFVLFISPKPATWARAIEVSVLFLFYALLGTGGKLFISLLKRQAGTESGILSRYGGVLDRIGAQMPILPLFPYFLP
jgi:phosphatidate cytidylyltransferase